MDEAQPVYQSQESFEKPKSKKMLFFLIFFFLFIVIGCVVGYFVYDYLGKPHVVREEIERQGVSCTDSDGNDIYTKGRLDYDSGGGLEDWCDFYDEDADSRVGLIREGICEGSTVKMVFMTCGRGYVCRNGACVKGSRDLTVCYDSDGGKDETEKGEISGYGGTGEDSCWVSVDGTEGGGAGTNQCGGDLTSDEECYVSEYYCEGDLKKNELILCPNGCLEGECL